MMIAVNLRPGTKRGKAAGPSLASGLEWAKGLGSAVKDPLRLLAIAAWVGVAGFLGWSFLHTASQLHSLEPKISGMRAEHRRFQDFISQKKKEEAVRDSILAQIRTLKQVDADRYVWPHVLDEVARALPPFTWLVDVGPVPVAAQAGAAGAASARPPTDTAAAPAGPPPVDVQITGRTVDIQGYTRFMRQLEDSPWLGNVTAVSATTVVERGRAVTAFVLKATYTRPDASHLHMVPVAETVGR
jgi:Tfp pilus assembly protein PilN